MSQLGLYAFGYGQLRKGDTKWITAQHVIIGYNK